MQRQSLLAHGYLLHYRQHDYDRLIQTPTTAQRKNDALTTTGWSTKAYYLGIFVIDHRHIGGIALMRRGTRLHTTTDKYRVYFDELLPFEPLAMTALPRLLRRALFTDPPSAPITVVDTPQWQQLIDAIKQARSDHADTINRLLDRANEVYEQPKELVSHAWASAAMERDALKTVFELAGITKGAFPSFNPTQPEPLRAILRPLDEQTMITNDMLAGMGWPQEHRSLKATNVAQFRQGTSVLTVLNVNKTSLEHILGVDLIYYHHQRDSYLILQYKRMRRDTNHGWIYYPNDDYRNELKRMKRVERMSKPTKDRSMRNYRFNQQWIYVKFCATDQLDPQANQLVKGLYLPLDFLEAYHADPSTHGPRGGIRISSDIPHLDSASFLHLAQSGWIGSRSIQSQHLRQFIKNANKSRSTTSLIFAALNNEESSQQMMDL